MIVKVLRYSPEKDKEPCFQSYEIMPEPDWTVMDVLDYIALNNDSTLAYFRHSACDHGVCARCTMKINGKVGMACVTVVGELDELVLEPKNGKVVRDLVTV